MVAKDCRPDDMSSQTALLLDFLRVLPVPILLVVSFQVLGHRRNTVAKPFVVFVLVLTAWGSLTLLPGRLGIPEPSGYTAMHLDFIRYSLAVVLPPLWLLYAGRYSGRGEGVTRRTVALVFFPISIVLAIAGAFLIVGERLPSFAFGALATASVLLIVYCVGLFLVGFYLFARLARQYPQLSYTQILTLGTAVAAPYLLLTISSLSEPAEGGETTAILSVNLTFVGFLIAGLLLLFALWRYPLFTAFPASENVARETILEELSEAVFILNNANEILDLNTSAVELSTRSEDQLIGHRLHSALEGLPTVPITSMERFELQTRDGPRQFESSTSEIPDGEGGLLGRTVLLRDVTQRTTREEQLEVLTRVLRHNLRNDLDTVLAYAEEVDDPTVRQPIQAHANRLDNTARKARTVEEVLSTTQDPYSSVDVGEVVNSVASRFREEYSDCEISVDVPAELQIRSHHQLLERLVTELVENAIRHNDQEHPEIEVIAQISNSNSENTCVRLEVSDNGPGIPERERDIIQSEGETPLKHGTGLGLWLVSWIATTLNGELSFSEHDAERTVVTVLIRADVTSICP